MHGILPILDAPIADVYHAAQCFPTLGIGQQTSTNEAGDSVSAFPEAAFPSPKWVVRTGTVDRGSIISGPVYHVYHVAMMMSRH